MLDWKQWEGRVADGRFPLRQYLGGSGHSAVFLTEYGPGTPRMAAIKLVPADSAAAQVWILRREFAGGLSHPGLLPVFQFGTCRIEGTNLVYTVMEQSEEDLSQVIPDRPLTSVEACEMMPAVLETLAYLHGEGFVHGGLTPANIMAAGDQVKISSDGLLRIGEPGDDLRPLGVNAPPESRAGLMPASDVWSVGMTLVEVLTQRAPDWDGNAAHDPVVPESLAAPFLDIARRCLRADPRLRCSLAEVSLALRPVSVAPVPGAKPAAPNPAPKPLPAMSAPQQAPATPPQRAPEMDVHAVARVARRKSYLLPVAAAILAGILFGVVMGTRRLSSPPAAEARRPIASETAAMPERNAQVTVTPVATESVAPATAPVSAAPAAEAEAAPTPLAPSAPPVVPNPAATATAMVTTPGASTGKRSAAEVVDRYVPEVPPQILRTIRGKVKFSVQVTVDPSGAVVDAQPSSSSGGKYFNRLALDAARRWKFKPASDPTAGAGTTRVLRFEFRRDGCEVLAE